MRSFVTDAELLWALRNKQPEALETLYDRYANLMYSLALQILQKPQEAEDLIHDIFLALWQHCNYDPLRGSFKTFLLLITRSRALDRLRHHKVRQKNIIRQANSLKEEIEYDFLWKSATNDELSKRVKDAILELPENQQKALWMAYFEGYTQQAIAEKLNVPLGTIKSWFRLGFTKLRRTLNDLTEENL